MTFCIIGVLIVSRALHLNIKCFSSSISPLLQYLQVVSSPSECALKVVYHGAEIRHELLRLLANDKSQIR